MLRLKLIHVSKMGYWPDIDNLIAWLTESNHTHYISFLVTVYNLCQIVMYVVPIISIYYDYGLRPCKLKKHIPLFPKIYKTLSINHFLPIWQAH